MRHFYKELPDYQPTGIQRIKVSSPTVDPNEDTAIRLYCAQSGSRWNLQIRGFYQDSKYRKGKKWYIATAGLNVDDLRDLRDACDEALQEIESETAA